MINLELRQVRYFVAVAEELHFGRAATRLHIVQPALSMQIRSLEENLGVVLLRRTKRVVELTEPGRLFLAEARSLLLQAENSVDVARQAGRGDAGHLIIGCSSVAMYTDILSPLIRRFHRLSPDVTFAFKSVHPALQGDALTQGTLDLSVVMLPGLDAVPGMAVCPLADWSISLVLPAEHQLASQTEIGVEQLRHEEFISCGTVSEDICVSALAKLGGYTPNVVYQAQTPNMIVMMVGAELGIGIVPDKLDLHDSSSVVFRRLDNALPSFPVVLLYDPSNAKAALRRLVESARAS